MEDAQVRWRSYDRYEISAYESVSLGGGRERRDVQSCEESDSEEVDAVLLARNDVASPDDEQDCIDWFSESLEERKELRTDEDTEPDAGNDESHRPPDEGAEPPEEAEGFRSLDGER